MTKHIPCPLCGQIVILDIPEGTDEEQYSALALYNCNCDASRIAVRLKEQADEAKLNIEDLCRSDDGMFEPVQDTEIIDFMFIAIDLIAAKKIPGVSIKLGGNSRINISLGGKDQINVKRSLNISEQKEAKSRL